MSRLWHGGAELNSVTDGMEVDTNSGTVSVSTTQVRSGTYAWRSNPTAGTGFFRKQISGSDQNKAGYLRLYVYIVSLPASTVQLLRFSSTANAHLASIRLTSSGTLTLNGANNTQIGSASSALSTGQWYMIELKCDSTNATGTVDARLEGSSFASGNNSSRGSWARILWGPVTPNVTCDIYMDDVALNDAAGSAQTSWPGSGKLIALRPNAQGDSNQWLQTAGGAGASTNYQLVDEVTPNNATDYVQSTTLNDTDFYNMGASGIGSGDTVNVVTGHARITNDTADATSAVKVRIEKTGSGTVSEGSAMIPNSTTWMTDGATATFLPSLILYLDPDGGAWTQTTLDSMQAGIKLTADTANKILVSAVWVYVDYTPSAGSALTKDLTDTVSLSDALVKAPNLIKTDSMTMADSRSGRPNLIKSDTLTLSDSKVTTFGKVLTDSFTIADMLGKLCGLNKAETISLADSLVKVFGKALTDNATLSDVLIKTSGKSLTDLVTASDLLAKTIGLQKTDTQVLSDMLARVAVLNKADTLTLFDFLSKSAAISPRDTLSLVDALSKTTNKPLSDSFSISDVLRKMDGKGLADNISITDSNVKTQGKSLSDTVSVSDTIKKNLEKIISDSFSIVDSLVVIGGSLAGRIYETATKIIKHRLSPFSSKTGNYKKKNDAFDAGDDEYKKKLY